MGTKYKVGDRVKVVCPMSPFNGEVTTVIAVGVRAWHDKLGYSEGCYRVDLPLERPHPNCSAPFAAFREFELIPIYDGNEKVAWSDCAWQPNNARVC